MCGSEGTLGIITKIVSTVVASSKDGVDDDSFVTNEEACAAIASIFYCGHRSIGNGIF